MRMHYHRDPGSIPLESLGARHQRVYSSSSEYCIFSRNPRLDPNILAQAAAYHAEEMLPFGRFPVRTESIAHNHGQKPPGNPGGESAGRKRRRFAGSCSASTKGRSQFVPCGVASAFRKMPNSDCAQPHPMIHDPAGIVFPDLIWMK